MSLLTRPFDFQHMAANPFAYFDPCFPSRVIEYTADRLLRTRIAQTLEEAPFTRRTTSHIPCQMEASKSVPGLVFFPACSCVLHRIPATSTDILDQDRCPREMVWEMLWTRIYVLLRVRLFEATFTCSYPTRKDKALFKAAREEYELIAPSLKRVRVSGG